MIHHGPMVFLGFPRAISNPVLHLLIASLLAQLALTGRMYTYIYKSICNFFRYHSHSQGLLQDGQFGAIFIRWVV